MNTQAPPTRVGMIGCGAISAQYLQTFDRLGGVDLVAVSDLDSARAEEAAAGREGVRVLTSTQLIEHDSVDVVLNLTIPIAHADISLQAIAAGKAIYGEKPLTADAASGRSVLDAAETAGVRLGCAPDTVLGTGTQTARALIDGGRIGSPVAASAVMLCPGHERWHPNPDFYYQPGGGPLLDMGPYYISALITLLGPITSVIGAASRSRAERVIGSGPREGESIPVDVDTHVIGVLTHAGGALSTLVMSFDAVGTQAAPIEVHGQQGSLLVPDPNHFDGEVKLRELGSPDWLTMPVSAGYQNAARGYGIADLANTPAGQEPRAGGRLGYHVLDVMQSLLRSADLGAAVVVSSSAERPAPVPLTSLS